MVIAQIGNSAGASTSNGVTSFTLPLAQTTTAGDCLILCTQTSAGGAQITSATANPGSLAMLRAIRSGNQDVWVYPNTTGTITQIDVVQVSATTSAIAAEFSGLALVNVVDDNSAGAIAGTNPNWANNNIVVNGDDMLLASVLNTSGTSKTFTVSSPSSAHTVATQSNSTNLTTLFFAWIQMSTSVSWTGTTTGVGGNFTLVLSLKAFPSIPSQIGYGLVVNDNL